MYIYKPPLSKVYSWSYHQAMSQLLLTTYSSPGGIPTVQEPETCYSMQNWVKQPPMQPRNTNTCNILTQKRQFTCPCTSHTHKIWLSVSLVYLIRCRCVTYIINNEKSISHPGEQPLLRYLKTRKAVKPVAAHFTYSYSQTTQWRTCKLFGYSVKTTLRKLCESYYQPWVC